MSFLHLCIIFTFFLNCRTLSLFFMLDCYWPIHQNIKWPPSGDRDDVPPNQNKQGKNIRRKHMVAMIIYLIKPLVVSNSIAWARWRHIEFTTRCQMLPVKTMCQEKNLLQNFILNFVTIHLEMSNFWLRRCSIICKETT